MTDNIEGLEYDVSEDPREQLQERIAESLAKLSEADVAPFDIETCSHFNSDDVDFRSEQWVQGLLSVQGWLHLDEDLPTSSTSDFVSRLVDLLGFDRRSEGMNEDASGHSLTETALERLSQRAEQAIQMQQTFLVELDDENGTQATASNSWEQGWNLEDDSGDDVAPEAVAARTNVWPIYQLTKKRLNLTPSYQRGDVWRTGDRQALIESIVRGIPLPSIILLKTGAKTPHDVVDGKQRLTAILRFVGEHPIAVAKVKEASDKYPEADFQGLFKQDYPKFRKAWKQVMGEPLTAKLEDDFYFPFKLRADEKGGLIGPVLEPLRGKYYTQIKANVIDVASEEITVEELFEGAPDYKVPVIEYTTASQRQIHEVFKLYNKQGVHLNAEEIRNAIFHDIELTRAILVAAGDSSSLSKIADVAPALERVPQIEKLGRTLKEYGFGDTRYRRTKVLGWIVAVLLYDTGGKDLAATARHIDGLLRQVQGNKSHPLRDEKKLSDLFEMISRAAELHASRDELWSDRFKDGGSGVKWQELQLVGSFVGIVIALAGSPNDIEDRIDISASTIREKTSSEAWRRPPKTQTRNQWDYIARIAKGIVAELGVDSRMASDEIRRRFGSSGVESLLRSIHKYDV